VCTVLFITDSVLVDLGIHTILLLGTTRNITFLKCVTVDPKLSRFRLTVETFPAVATRQGATSEPYSHYADCIRVQQYNNKL